MIQLMIDARSLAIDVQTHSRLMSLAVQDDGGLWVSDVQFVADDQLNIYWCSMKNVRHSAAIRANPRVAGSIHFNLQDREHNMGLQFTGIATELPPNSFQLTEKYFTKYGYEREEKTRQFFQPTVSWYKLEPNKMELFYLPEFGYEKQPIKTG